MDELAGVCRGGGAAARGACHGLLPSAAEAQFLIEHSANIAVWSILIVTGILISVLIELLHRSRRWAEASRRRQAVTLASIGDGVITTDTRGHVTFLNREAERLTGWQSRQAAGQPLTSVFKLVNDETREAVEDPVGKVLNPEKAVGLSNHAVLLSRDGRETPVDESAAPIRQDGGATEGVVLVFRDRSRWKQAKAERRRAEAAFQRLNAELEQRVQERTAQLEASNKELESFSYSVSHDLRSPLRAIDGYALMLEEDHASRLDDEGRRLLGVVRGEAGRMGRLIDDLLAFSRIGAKPVTAARIDMPALARGVVTELSKQYPAASVLLGELPPANGDGALVKQVWMNLVGNALKYSSKREAPRIEIGGCTEGGERKYWIKDNGAGFDMRCADKLFGVFRRLHGEEEFPGTGVGLAIVQRVVSRHGGRIWGDGEVGRGASFFFTLPTNGAGHA